jgi:DNA end-binding protein Ku
MPRSLWSGAISFGLVTIPVKLVTAVREKGISLHLLTKDGSCRLHNKLYCPETGQEYELKDTARGYEIAKDEYLLIQPEELEMIKPASGKAIVIKDFVTQDAIDPVYFDKPYYLLPDKVGARAYALLVQAMEAEGRTAIAKVTIRENEYLAALRVREGLLCLETMRFDEEVVPLEEIRGDLPQSEEKPDDREVTMARQLIGALKSDFEPSKYINEYRERLQQLINQKAAGQPVFLPGTEEAPKAPMVDLMAVLKASLDAEQKAQPAAGLPASTGKAVPETKRPTEKKKPK